MWSLFICFVFFKQKPQVIQIIAQAASLSAMIGGQAISLRVKKTDATKRKIYKIYKMKTGALIEASIEGCFKPPWGEGGKAALALKNFGRGLGLAFQLADDLQDGPLEEGANILQVIKRALAEKELKKLTNKSLSFLSGFKKKDRLGLERLALFNEQRALAVNN